MSKEVTGRIFTQLEPENPQKSTYYYKEGVTKLGEDAIKSIVIETKELDDKQVFDPLHHAHELNPKQKEESLHSISMFTHVEKSKDTLAQTAENKGEY
jgi:hypothetical protein